MNIIEPEKWSPPAIRNWNRPSAAELGLSCSTVKRALDDLCKAGLVSKESRWRENRSLTSNLSFVKT